MSDEQNATPAVIETPEKKPGFLSTSGGRIVAIVLGIAVLLTVAGVVAAIVFGVFASQAVDQIQEQIQTPGTAETTTTAGGTVTPTAPAPAAPAPEVPNAEVFTFRNIFVPLLKPLAAAAGDGTGSTTTTDTVTSTAANTLYLDGVVTQDGVLRAQLRYNGVSYTLGAGGVIPNSPWQVLRVSATSVTMLFGDNQVNLSVGQGITK